MQEIDHRPIVFQDACANYLHYREVAAGYVNRFFNNEEGIQRSERYMLVALRAEIRRLRWQTLFPTNIERETLKLIRLFFLRERREDVHFRQFSHYLKSFMKANRISMIRPWIPNDHTTYRDVIAELVKRLTPPWEDPQPVLTEWLPQKLEEAVRVIPEGIVANGGIGKIFRVVAGVYLYALTDFKSDTPLEEAKRRLDLAIKGGYYFGLFHPLVDDILDSSNHLNESDKVLFLRLLDDWVGGNFDQPNPFESHRSIAALKIAMKELFELYPSDQRRELMMLSYGLHFAQAEDMQKQVNESYSIESVYVPVLLKAAFTRLIGCWLSGTKLTTEVSHQLLETGLVFQLMDDFRDLLPDLAEGNFTPFTHYCSCGAEKPLNPWLVYLRVTDLFIRGCPNEKVAREAILHRFAISIQNCGYKQTDKSGRKSLETILAASPGSWDPVNWIINYKHRIVDPDRALFEPVDWFFRPRQ